MSINGAPVPVSEPMAGPLPAGMSPERSKLLSVSTLKPASPPSDRAELVPKYFETERIVTLEDNPVYTPPMLADLLESMREDGQLVPGWVCPSAELPGDQLLCLEGNRRLAVARKLGLPFWAFDIGRFVPEAERIKLTFSHNFIRRRMSRDEIAERAARYIELTDCTQDTAARVLNVSPATLSRAFGERRIPQGLRERADRLALSIRSLVASVPVPLMARAIEFAETPGTDGKKPTRDQVSLFIRQLRKNGTSKARKGKTVTLRLNGRAVTLAVGDKDSAFSVAEDLKAIVARLGKHGDVPPDGWPFLFQ
jgi:ParB-like chromosome segregation protein Spo0J